MVSPESLATLPEAQQAVIRQVFAAAFTKDMQVSAIVAGIGLLLTLGTYRRNAPTIDEMSAERVREEKERRRASRVTALDSASE